MSQEHAYNNFVAVASRKANFGRTVSLRMRERARQDRAERIRALKRQHPEHTWEAIAKHCGVTIRAAQGWQEKGGIAYKHALKLAELWSVDVDFIMQGPRERSMDLMVAAYADDLSQLDRIERLLLAIAERLGVQVTELVAADDLLQAYADPPAGPLLGDLHRSRTPRPEANTEPREGEPPPRQRHSGA